jgi:hypothetical protein|nr:MAG TPA: hypothetical protein [Caudoviricetes sp.]
MLNICEIAGFIELKRVSDASDNTKYKKFGEDFLIVRD